MMRMPLEHHMEVDSNLIMVVIEASGLLRLTSMDEAARFLEELATSVHITPHQLYAMIVFAEPLFAQPMFLHRAMRGEWRLALGIGLSFALKLLEESSFWISDLYHCSAYFECFTVHELSKAERFAFGVIDCSHLQHRLQSFKERLPACSTGCRAALAPNCTSSTPATSAVSDPAVATFMTVVR